MEFGFAVEIYETVMIALEGKIKPLVASIFREDAYCFTKDGHTDSSTEEKKMVMANSFSSLDHIGLQLISTSLCASSPKHANEHHQKFKEETIPKQSNVFHLAS